MLKKILFGLGGLIILVLVSLFIFIQVSWNKVHELPYPDLKTSTDSAVLARGKYLVNGPAHCSACHVGGYQELINADKGEAEPLKGGVKFPLGPLGVIYTRNLTPDSETGIGRYTDGEIFRLMRHGVKPDGTSTITPMMPFYNMADEDLIAIVSYLKSLEPINNKVPEAEYTMLGKFVRSVAPPFQPILNPNPPAKAPPMAPTLERGEYLARYVANCVGCHTARDPQTFDAVGPEFAGGFEMEPLPELHELLGVNPELWIRTPNITPHPESNFSRFKTLDEWIKRFRTGRLIPNSPMQWGPFSKMTDEDLEALWIFLNSLEPIENNVEPIMFVKE